MRINLTDVEDRSFEAIPSSRYVLKVASYEMREVKNDGKVPKGTPMINWEFNVISDAKTGDTKYENRKLWMNSIIHEKTMPMLKSFLRATGLFENEQLAGEIDFEPEDVIGSLMVGVVAQREYNGDITNDIKRVVPLSDAEREEASLLP
jgi:hypothetical protein